MATSPFPHVVSLPVVKSLEGRWVGLGALGTLTTVTLAAREKSGGMEVCWKSRVPNTNRGETHTHTHTYTQLTFERNKSELTQQGLFQSLR